MKLFLVFLSLAFAPASPTILLLDTGLKADIRTTDKFSVDDYFRGRFPVHADDVAVIADAAERLAKQLGQQPACEGTVAANQSTFHFTRHCESDKTITIRLTTRLSEANAVFNFTLVNEEGDRRRAQQKLLLFADYLLRYQP